MPIAYDEHRRVESMLELMEKEIPGPEETASAW